MDQITKLVALLAPHLKLVLGVTGVLILTTIMSLVAAFRSSQKKAPGLDLHSVAGKAAAAAGVGKLPPIPADSWSSVFKKPGRQILQLRQSFASANEMLKARVAGRSYRYQIPWFIMMGESASGKTTLLDNSHLSMPFGRPGGDPFGLRQACNWWLFDHGIVLDVNGEFVLTADGKGSDDSAWRSFLRLLLKYRNERPIDGIVLAIPASDLVGPTRLSPETLAKKADTLYEKLWTAQKLLGICVPVYVLVTKSDQIAGFGSFARGIPEHLQDDIFGWSNPYAVQLSYLSEWVDEAFDSIQEELRRTQVEIFAEKPDVEDADGLFLFPSEVQSVREPLRVYLNHIFKDSVYHEEFYFRGLYFTGDAEATGGVESAESADQHPRTRRPIFLKSLFEKKVFPEFRLARPVYQALLSKNRYIRAAQIAAAILIVVGGIGLWRSDVGLGRDIGTLLPVLESLSRDLTQITGLEKTLQQQGAKDMKPLEDLEQASAQHLLSGMEDIQATTMKRLFIPQSWFSTIDNDIAHSLSLAYDKIILNAIYLDLNERIDAMLSVEAVEPLPEEHKLQPFVETPGFIRLQKFTVDVAELEARINDYNSLANPDSGDLTAVGRLVKYLFGVDLPQGFYANSRYYEDALKSSRHVGVNTTTVKIRVLKKLEELGQRYRQAFESGLPEHEFDDVIDKVNLLAQDRTSANSNNQPYQDMIQSVDKLQSIIARPELAFLEKPKFEPAPEAAKVLDAIQQSQLMGPVVRQQIERLGAETFQDMRTKLFAYETVLTGPILDASQPEFKLAPSVLALRKATEDFLNQRFMASQTSKRIRSDLPARTLLTWDPKLLQDAIQLTEPYNVFIANGISTFPEQLRSKLRVMALNRLEANMIDIISRAESLQRLAPGNQAPAEAELQDEAKHLKDVSKPIDQLLNAFDQMELTRSYEDLSSLQMSEAIRLLSSVDQLAKEKGLYSFDFASLSTWDGESPVSKVTFGAQDAKALGPYLDAQRENMKSLARDLAEPSVTFLKARPGLRRNRADEQLFAKWSGILTELDKYDNKVPANNIAVIESFISTDMPALTTDNYAEKITQANLTEHSDDFFLNARNDLRHALYDRYRAVSGIQAARYYTEMQTFFNQRLASRFPFTANADRIETEADPDAIRGFFALFDAHAKTIEKYVESGIGGGQSTPLQFLDAMESVRTFFAPFLSDGKSLTPVFDFETDFRVNRRHETGGNQIIDWSFEVGDQKITSRDTQKRGRWNAGDPVRVVMRWAKDGDITPVPPDLPSIRVDDKTVTYEYDNRWAVLALVRQHLGVAADFDQLVDPNPSTMRFIIPTIQGSDSSTTPVPAETKVFVRLTLLSADKKEPIPLPTFPDRAPVWNRNGATNRN